MPLITDKVPATWQELEIVVRDILRECGLNAERQVTLKLPRGGATVDVLAEETIDGIASQIVCECKDWATNVPQEVVHAFRTVVQEIGAHRGFVISRVGFQTGARAAAANTNISLVTFEEFQELYFKKWYLARRWGIENDVGDINDYYEPFGIPGINQLESEEEKDRYYSVWKRYLFVGLLLSHFAPYMAQLGRYSPPPPLPLDIENLDRMEVDVPTDVRNATGLRELLKLLEDYAREGLAELRKHNPITQNAEAIAPDADGPVELDSTA